MHKYRAVCVFIALLISQQSYADVFTTSNSIAAASSSNSDDASLKQCENIAKACLNAGFRRSGRHQGKAIWRDCMKPILLGQIVKGVTFNPQDVTSCREFKITKMKKELEQLQSLPIQTQTQ